MAFCLVTGGAGFIGSHLVDALLAQGHGVRVLDNFSTGTVDNLRQARPNIELIEGDVTDPAALRTATAGVDWVFHQAALASVPRSIADPLATHRVCADGSLQVLLAAREAGVRRVIYAASSSAYGDSLHALKREMDPTRPLSPYAVAKLAGEHYCAAFTQVYGLETVRLRYFNVFGPRQPPNSPYSAVIPLFFNALLEGRRPQIQGDGQQSRDFTFVLDIVQANLLAATAPEVAGKVYNVGGGRRTSLLELLNALNAALGTHLEPQFVAPRPGDVRHSQADISRAKADLGYRPMTALVDGLRQCVPYYAALHDQAQSQTKPSSRRIACSAA